MRKVILTILTVIASTAAMAQGQLENLIICNEGNWQQDNGQLSYLSAATGEVTNQWFRQVNGFKLGDTPNDIIQINDTLIAIAVNWSNIIQYIRPDGTACGATENVPNNRRMCTDPTGRYLFITSYAHKCGSQKFTKGYVAKIDVTTKQVVGTCEVGWEPEGIRYYKGKLYIANTGGYSFSESHEYETTIQVVDATTMKSLKTIETGCINLYSEMSQAGQYLCVNSCGDYYSVQAKTVVIDCESDKAYTFDFPATYNTTDGKRFYCIGSAFSYYTYAYEFSTHTIDPSTMTYTKGVFCSTITDKIASLTQPYEIYVSPYTGNVYMTDARAFANAGYLYGYTPDGQELFEEQKVYLCPAHILALPPAGASFTGIKTVEAAKQHATCTYNLSGQPVDKSYKGIVVKNGKKGVVR